VPWKTINICKYCRKLFKSGYNPDVLAYLNYIKKKDKICEDKNSITIQNLPIEIFNKIILLGYNYGPTIPDSEISNLNEVLESRTLEIRHKIKYKTYNRQKSSRDGLLFSNDLSYPTKCSMYDGVCSC